MPIQILNGVRSSSGAHPPQRGSSSVFPKRGRLATGSYFPGDQSRSEQIRGNCFGPNTAPLATRQAIAPERAFGTRSNAGNGSTPFDSRVTLGATETHPNAGFHVMALNSYVPPIASNTGGKVERLIGVVNPVVQPHERNVLLHNKARKTHHAAFGASHVLPSDTAFRRIHPKEKPRAPVRPQTYTLKVMRNPSTRVPSFTSRNNLWVDPNNSFLQGVHNPIAGGTGAGRWQTVKRGAGG